MTPRLWAIVPVLVTSMRLPGATCGDDSAMVNSTKLGGNRVASRTGTVTTVVALGQADGDDRGEHHDDGHTEHQHRPDVAADRRPVRRRRGGPRSWPASGSRVSSRVCGHAVRLRWNDAQHDQHDHHCGADEGDDGGDPGDGADGRPGVGRQEQAAQRLALEQRVALVADGVGIGLQLVDGRLRGAVGDGVLDGGGCRPLGTAQVGVGGTVGEALEVAADVAGVGLGLAAGGHLLAGVLEQVAAAVILQRGGVRERDVLRRQLVTDVVLGEPVAPDAGGRRRRTARRPRPLRWRSAPCRRLGA